MSDSLRDQLLGLGFKPMPKPEKPAHDGKRSGPPAKPGAHAKPGAKPGQGGVPTQREGARPHPSKHHASKPHPSKHHPSKQHPSKQHPSKQHPSKQHPSKPRSQEEIDLAKAYAIRAQREKEERIEAERLKQEEARKRREAKAKLAEFLKDKALNDKDAEIARHFPYGGKIKRIYVNEAQLKQLNAGELGVVQLDGRYVLVTAATLTEAETIFPAAVALKVDPNAPAEDDPYADPKYQVPDDLVW